MVDRSIFRIGAGTCMRHSNQLYGVPLLVQHAQSAINLRGYCREMQCMEYRNIAYECATGEGRPIKCVCMDEIKLGAAPLQREKEFKKEIGLCKEARISGTLLPWLGEVGRAHAIRDCHWLNGDARDEGIVFCEEGHLVSALHQT